MSLRFSSCTSGVRPMFVFRAAGCPSAGSHRLVFQSDGRIRRYAARINRGDTWSATSARRNFHGRSRGTSGDTAPRRNSPRRSAASPAPLSVDRPAPSFAAAARCAVRDPVRARGRCDRARATRAGSRRANRRRDRSRAGASPRGRSPNNACRCARPRDAATDLSARSSSSATKPASNVMPPSRHRCFVVDQVRRRRNRVGRAFAAPRGALRSSPV